MNARPKRFPPEPLLSVGTWVVREAIVQKERADEEGRKPHALASVLARVPRWLGYRLGAE